MKIKFILLSVLFIFILGTLSCQPSVTGTKKTIVVTYSVLGSVVKELVGDKADVIVSMPNGMDPHDWEPSAKDVENINKADLVIDNGLELESGLQKTFESAKDKGVEFFTASDYITVRHVGQGEGIPSGDPDQAIGAADPHLWTDPLVMKTIVTALVPVLKNELDLDVSGEALNLENRLDALNTEISEIVTALPVADRKLVTGHESMGYFARRYNFKLVGVIIPSISSQAEVSAADLAGLKQTIHENQVKAIFTELGTSPVVANAIGKETGATVIELTTHSLPDDGSYFTFEKNLATVIVNGLK
jgi:zinc/manganese transport system substrate-binding protein